MNQETLKAILNCAALAMILTWCPVAIEDVESANAAQQDEVSQPTIDELTPVFEWFDSLGYGTLSSDNFVRVATGFWQRVGDQPPENHYRYALLQQEEGERFEVVHLDLSRRWYQRTPEGQAEFEAVRFEPASLSDYVETLMSEPKMDDDPFDRFGAEVSEDMEWFVLASASADSMRSDLAVNLIRTAWSGEGPENQEVRIAVQVREKVEQELGHAEMWRAVRDFGNTTCSRRDLLARFDRIVELFPKSAHCARAQTTADLLREMVAEDERQSDAFQQSVEDLTDEEKIARLIFQLRDQNGYQYSQPGACDIFADPRGERSPAHQLRALGFAAVPQLIDAIDDRRLTRSVGYHRNFYFSHHVLRVGDCALTILESIAQRRFTRHARLNRQGDRSDVAQADEVSETALEVLEWWNEVEAKGIEQVLVEATMLGDRNSPRQALQLLERYPERAAEAIRAGYESASDQWTKTNLVRLAGNSQRNDLVVFVSDVMRGEGHASIRATAAVCLWEQGRSEALDWAIEQWEGWTEVEGPLVQVENGGRFDIASILVTSDELRAIEALTKRFDEYPLQLRFHLVNQLREHQPEARDEDVETQPRGLPISDVERAIEQLFVGVLDDRQGSISVRVDGQQLHGLRVCDAAAVALSVRFPGRYRYDLAAIHDAREAQLVIVENSWREIIGLEPLVVPVRRTYDLVDDQRQIRPLLEAWAIAGEPEQVRIETSLLSLGPGAIPILRMHSRASTSGEDLVTMTSSLEAKLANSIRGIKILDSASLPDTTVTAIRSLEGSVVSGDLYVDLLINLLSNLPEGVVGIDLELYRLGDDAGVDLILRPLTASEVGSPSDGGWRYSSVVKAGNEISGGASGSSSTDYKLHRRGYTSFIEDIDEAVTVDPQVYYQIRFRIWLD